MTLLVDARGMRCPWPALRLARAMRSLSADGMVHLRADDPLAAREVEALAAAHGWHVAEVNAGSWFVSPGDRAA